MILSNFCNFFDSIKAWCKNIIITKKLIKFKYEASVTATTTII